MKWIPNLISVFRGIESDVPIGMFEVQAKTIKQKPNAKVSIGQPIELERIEGIQ